MVDAIPILRHSLVLSLRRINVLTLAELGSYTIFWDSFVIAKVTVAIPEEHRVCYIV